MLEFHLSEIYVRQQQQRITNKSERHRITRPGRRQKRTLTSPTAELRFRLCWQKKSLKSSP